MATQQEPTNRITLSLEDKIELSIELARIALECKDCSGRFKQAIENREIAIAIKMNANDDCRHDGGLTVDSSQQDRKLQIENTESRL